MAFFQKLSARFESIKARLARRYPRLNRLVEKLAQDNVGLLAAFLSWSILTSLIPLIIGIAAISGAIIGNSGTEKQVTKHMSQAFQGALSQQDIENLVNTLTQKSGLLAVIGILGILWGGSNIGGAFSTSFRLIFECESRSFVREKLIDIGMIFLFTALMLVTVLATTASVALSALFKNVPIAGEIDFILGVALGLISALILFGAIYTVFPNISAERKLRFVWLGTLLAACAFVFITYMWPLYIQFSHASRYGTIMFTIIVLTAWIYFFSMIALIGAEIIAVASTPPSPEAPNTRAAPQLQVANPTPKHSP